MEISLKLPLIYMLYSIADLSYMYTVYNLMEQYIVV